MQYQACPKEPWCGKYFVNPTSDGAVKNLEPLTENTGSFSQFKSAVNNYYNGALCTYQLSFPIEAEEKDKLAITLKESKNVEVFFIASQRYGTNEYLYKNMTNGQELSIRYPYKVYLTIVSNSTDSSQYGQYKIEAKFKKYDPDAPEDSGEDTSGIAVVYKNSTKTVTVGKWKAIDCLF